MYPPRFVLRPVAASITLAVATLAGAQSQQTPTGTLSEVKVTSQATTEVKVDESASQKITAPLLDTPKSVTVIPNEVIKQTGAVSLQEALRTAPGISFGAGEGGNSTGDRPFIRGFDAQTDTYIDGVRDGGAQTREIFNLEQIEVVKGPSSAFGGRGSAGGSIDLVSKTAKAEDFIGGSLGLGTDRYRRATLDLNKAFSESIAARLNVFGHASDIAGRDEVNVKRYGVAPTITFGMNGPTKATLSYYYMKTDDLPDAGGFPYNNPFAATSPNAGLNGDGRPIDAPREAFYGLVDRDFQKTQANIGTIDLSHDFGWAKLRNVTRLGKTKNDYLWTQPDDSKGNPNLYSTVWRRTNSRSSVTDSDVNQTSLTGDFTIAGIKNSYSAGIEYSREKTLRGSYAISPSTNNPLTNNQVCATTGADTGYNCTSLTDPNPNDPWAAGHTVTRSDRALDVRVKTKTKSAYVFDTLEFTPQWLLNLGLRFDDYETTMFTPSTSVTLRNKATFFNYQTGLVYKPVSNGSLYVSYGTASTPPGTDGGDGADGLSAAIQNLKPQSSRNVEAGVKWELFDRRLLLSAAVFQTKMNNARVTAADGTTQNIGKKRVNGVELGATGNVTKDWQIFGGYTHLDAKLIDNGYVSGSPSPYNGNKFPNTPEDSFSLWTSYNLLPGFTLGGGATYVSKQYGNVNNTKWIPGYTRFDAMASYVLSKNTSLQLNVQNLTDKRYYTKAYASHYASIAPGRSATLTLNYLF